MASVLVLASVVVFECLTLLVVSCCLRLLFLGVCGFGVCHSLEAFTEGGHFVVLFFFCRFLTDNCKNEFVLHIRPSDY